MTDHVLPLDDAMPGRKLRARWVVRGTFELETAMHLGGEGTGRVDMPVLRDPREGVPLLPGTTLAGALRNALADRLAGYGEKEPDTVSALFGGGRGDDDGSQSPLIVFDALGRLPEGLGIEIRDGVAISPVSGTAEDHKKYDYEVLPAGTTFAVRMDLLVPVDANEKRLVEALASALNAFSHGGNALGAKRSRGLGRVRATWAAKRFDLESSGGWMAWVRSDHADPIGVIPTQSCIRDVLDGAAPAEFTPLTLLGDTRRRVVLDLELILTHDILVRSPGTEPGAPDVSHLSSGGKPVLPGTSLAGVMRAQATRIAKLVRSRQDDADRWIDRLFGPRFQGQRPSPDHQPHASRVRVGEAIIEGTRAQRQTRVAIDRFTQGVVPTALFDEQTEVGGRAALRLELCAPRAGELGLILLVLKDLLSGRLPVGGTSSVGRGGVTGTATVTFHDGSGMPSRTAKLEPGRPPGGDAAVEIVAAIRCFDCAPPLEADTEAASPAVEIGGTP
jgi:CRISPR/Cas system CSM-associated protein Csm3 (group 7 of RAMP superfamily)